MIHRTCALTGAEYEWGVHVVAYGPGRSASATNSSLRQSLETRATRFGPGRERAVFNLADELHHTSTVSDELFKELERHFDTAQIIELCLTSGWYHTLAYVINVARIPLEPWAARFPGS